ncbi:hypothetical protein Tco_0817615 [Tanacetum coccineum]
MGEEGQPRTLGDYSWPSQKGYRNTIELPKGANDFNSGIYHVSYHLKREIDHAAGGKLHDKSVEESLEIIQVPDLYDNELWNGLTDLVKLVKAISLPQDVPNTKYCMENPEQAFVDYASLRTKEARGGRENLNVGEEGEERTPSGGLPGATGPVQMNPSLNFMKKNLGTLRIMIKELDRHGRGKGTPKMLLYEESESRGLKTSQESSSFRRDRSLYSDGLSRTKKSRSRAHPPPKRRKNGPKKRVISKSYQSKNYEEEASRGLSFPKTFMFMMGTKIQKITLASSPLRYSKKSGICRSGAGYSAKPCEVRQGTGLMISIRKVSTILKNSAGSS